jgi:hypothetical protein
LAVAAARRGQRVHGGTYRPLAAARASAPTRLATRVGRVSQPRERNCGRQRRRLPSGEVVHARSSPVLCDDY